MGATEREKRSSSWLRREAENRSHVLHRSTKTPWEWVAEQACTMLESEFLWLARGDLLGNWDHVCTRRALTHSVLLPGSACGLLSEYEFPPYFLPFLHRALLESQGCRQESVMRSAGPHHVDHGPPSPQLSVQP